MLLSFLQMAWTASGNRRSGGVFLQGAWTASRNQTSTSGSAFAHGQGTWTACGRQEWSPLLHLTAYLLTALWEQGEAQQVLSGLLGIHLTKVLEAFFLGVDRRKVLVSPFPGVHQTKVQVSPFPEWDRTKAFVSTFPGVYLGKYRVLANFLAPLSTEAGQECLPQLLRVGHPDSERFSNKKQIKIVTLWDTQKV